MMGGPAQAPPKKMPGHARFSVSDSLFSSETVHQSRPIRRGWAWPRFEQGNNQFMKPRTGNHRRSLHWEPLEGRDAASHFGLFLHHAGAALRPAAVIHPITADKFHSGVSSVRSHGSDQSQDRTSPGRDSTLDHRSTHDAAPDHKRGVDHSANSAPKSRSPDRSLDPSTGAGASGKSSGETPSTDLQSPKDA